MSDPLRTCMQPQRGPEWYGRFWQSWSEQGRGTPTDHDAVVAITALADLYDDGVIGPPESDGPMRGRFVVWGDDDDAIPLAPAASALMRPIAVAVAACPSSAVVL